jgi:hypothetical protein
MGVKEDQSCRWPTHGSGLSSTDWPLAMGPQLGNLWGQGGQATGKLAELRPDGAGLCLQDLHLLAVCVPDPSQARFWLFLSRCSGGAEGLKGVSVRFKSFARALPWHARRNGGQPAVGLLPGYCASSSSFKPALCQLLGRCMRPRS